MTIASKAWRLALGGLSLEEGLSLREGARTRHIASADPTRFADLLSIPVLDAFLRTDGARSPRVTLADSGRTGSASVPDDAFCSPDGRIDPPRLFAAYDAGATLVVSQFHEYHPPLADLCRGLERAFMHAVQANIYLTPSGAQGFRVHFDTHDVLVLQISGAKRWRIWDEGPVAYASRNTPWENGMFTPDEAKARIVDMGPGDVLYVPRGAPHDAAAQGAGEPSLHITIGLLEPTYADILHAAITQMEQRDVGLRQPFPTWRLSDESHRAGMVEALSARARALGVSEAFELAVLDWLNTLALERSAMVARGLTTAPPKPDERLILSDAVHTHLVPLGEGAELRWTGEPIALSATELDWLGRLEMGARVSDLGGPEALAFCAKLVALGLASRA